MSAMQSMRIEVGTKFKTRAAHGVNEIVRVTEKLVIYEMENGHIVPVNRDTFESRADPRNLIYYQQAKKRRKRRARK